MIRFTSHALDEMTRRGLSRASVEEVVRNPDQIVRERGTRLAYQSKVHFHDGVFLLRAVVERYEGRIIVITTYRTSRISKYWSTP